MKLLYGLLQKDIGPTQWSTKHCLSC